jgi:molybdate transport system permease protein
MATPLPWLAAIVLAYLTVPVVAFLVRFARTPPGQMSSPGVGAALVVSLESATIATVIIAVTGVPLGYLLSRGRRGASHLIGIAVQLPIALPPLMSGILLLYLVGPYSAIGRFFGGRLTDDFIGILLAQVFVAAPFAIVAARSAFTALDPSLDDVAATLGHHRMARFARVALPAAAPGIGAGLLLAWLRAFGEFGATVVLAYHPYSLPVFTYVQFGSTGLPATMLPVAASLAAAAVVLGLAVGLSRLRLARPAPSPLPPARTPIGRHGAPLAFALSGRLGSFSLELAHRGSSRRIGIVGTSGAGKTFTLRLLAGLAPVERGYIRLDGSDLTNAAPEARGVGYLPQDTSLLPRVPVWTQANFGVGADRALAAYWIERLNLARLVDRRPEQLSGGQRRRVGLARALSRSPRLLLLDEPLSGLDTPARADLRGELRRLQLETGLTTVVVTHDIDDAALLADEVLVLDEGRLLQSGALRDLFAHPASPKVARLLGLTNIHPATVIQPGLIRAGRLELEAEFGDLPVGTRLSWRIGPDDIGLGDIGLGPAAGYPATVSDVVDRGTYRQIEMALDAGPVLTMHTKTGDDLRPGERRSVGLPAPCITVWPELDAQSDGHLQVASP